MSEPTPGSPEDQAIWLRRAQESIASRETGTRRDDAPSRRRRRTGRGVSTYGTVLASPIDMERYARSGPVTGWTEASPDTIDWILSQREGRVTVRSPDGKTTLHVSADEAEEYRRDGWR